MIPLSTTLALLLGCEITQLDSASIVDRTRILGVKATPAEPAPGDTVTFSSLAVDPESGIAGVTWFGCVLEDSDSFGCELDTDTLEALFAQDPSTMTAQEQQDWYAELQAAGFLGIEPDLAPTLTVPSDLLDGLSEAQQAEGKNYMLTLSAIPGGLEIDDLDLDAEGTQAVGEQGLKRMPVSVGGTPNRNPEITSLTLDGEFDVKDQDVLEVRAGQTYTFQLNLSDDSVETYTFVDCQGASEDRTEQPYVSFYATTGSFYQTISLHPYLEAEWTAPIDPPGESHTLWFVLRDRRGGMDWVTVELLVR